MKITGTSVQDLLAINYYQLRSIRAGLAEMNQILEPSTRTASEPQL